MVTISEGAFAKVNLTLDVLGKREDGYHNIKSIMQTISLHDDVTVDIGTGAPWQVHCYREVLDETGRENPTTTLVTEGYPQDEKNLAWKAAKAYYAATKLPEEGLEIFISKRIPMQAGLAGGSADAAAVLRVLNRHYGYPLSLPAASEEDAAPEEPSQNAPAEPSEPLTFSPEEADAIVITGGCTYTYEKQALLMQPSTLDFSGDGPKILIVHTHASEAYTPEPGFTYEPSDTLRTQDETRSVIRLGSEIARILEDAGIETLHDTTHNDYPSYDGSYARMQTIIESYLAQYPSIQMVLDVHRDAVEDRAGFPAALTANIDGEEYARLMLVVGTDEGGLTHPRWQENLANALKLQALVNRSAPGLCRDIDLRTERFNQHETDGSLLCEFGASGNTLSQALRTARVFADVLVSFINGVAAAS